MKWVDNFDSKSYWVGVIVGEISMAIACLILHFI